jgi:hypothetical protein
MGVTSYRFTIIVGGWGANLKTADARRYNADKKRLQQGSSCMFYPQTIQSGSLATATKDKPTILRKTVGEPQNSFDCNAVWSEHGTWFQEVRGTASRTEAKRAWNVDPRLKLFR